MGKKIVLFAMLLLFCCTGAQARPQQGVVAFNEQAKKHFDFAERVISSGGHKYKIFIAAPKAPAPRGGNPVLYMLDGNGQFHLAVNSYDQVNGPAPLIVGIGYAGDAADFAAEHTRDYTVPAMGDEFKNGGGAEAFYQFIQNKVRPLINSTYRVNKRKQTLMGHSFGGLFTLYVLFNHTEAFQRYVAASPAIWWGNGCVVPRRAKLLEAMPQSLSITVGEYEQKPDPRQELSPERAARLAKQRTVERARDLALRLQNEGAPCVFISYPGRNKGSVLSDALAYGVLTAAQ